MKLSARREPTKTSKALRSFWAHLVAQLLVFATALVLPRLLISNYGSDTNGLLTAINQLFGYAALVEAGIGTAAIQVFYKYVTKDDKQTINGLLFRVRSFYRKASIFYVLIVLALAAVYPLFAKTEIDYWTIFFVMLIHGATGVLPYLTYSPFTMYLQAEGKSYVLAWVGTSIRLALSVAKIISYSMGANIIIVQAVCFGITLLQVLAFYLYRRKVYPELGYHKADDCPPVNGTLAYTINAASQTITSSTDTVVLSIVVSATASSVYGVYALIFSTLQNVLIAFMLGNFALGQSYQDNRDKFLKLHGALEAFVTVSVSMIMTIACSLSLPFVRLYTAGVSDANYIDPVLPFLFAIPVIFTFAYSIANETEKIAGKSKRVAIQAIVDGIVNLGLTIPFAIAWGIRGALIATCIASGIRMADTFYFANKRILGRPIFKSVKPLLIGLLLFFTFTIPLAFLDYQPSGYLAWAKLAVVESITIGTAFIAAFFAFCPEEARFVLTTLKSHFGFKKENGLDGDVPLPSFKKKKIKSVRLLLFTKKFLVSKAVLILLTVSFGGGATSLAYFAGSGSQQVQLYTKLRELDRVQHRFAADNEFRTHLEFVSPDGFKSKETVEWQLNFRDNYFDYMQTYFVWGKEKPVSFSTNAPSVTLANTYVASLSTFTDGDLMESIFLPLYKNFKRANISPKGGADVGCYISLQAANEIVASGAGPTTLEEFFETPYLITLSDENGAVFTASVNNIYCPDKTDATNPDDYERKLSKQGNYPAYFGKFNSNYIFSFNGSRANSYGTIRVVDAKPFFSNARDAIERTVGFDYANSQKTVTVSTRFVDGAEQDMTAALKLDDSAHGNSVFAGVNIFALLGSVLCAIVYLYFALYLFSSIYTKKYRLLLIGIVLCVWPAALANIVMWFLLLAFPSASLSIALAFNAFGNAILLVIGIILFLLLAKKTLQKRGRNL